MSQRIRNTGIVPLRATDIMSHATVAVAGVGGSGGSIITSLVDQYQLKCVKLADLDKFDLSNLNRQRGSYHHTLGLPKVKVVAELLRGKDRKLEIKEFDEGVQLDNLDEFLDGVDFVVDAIDFKKAAIHIELARRARARGIPLLIGIEICYGARAVWFSPDGMTFEDFFGLMPGETQELSLRCMIMRLPAYVDTNAFKAVAAGEIEAPAIATGGDSVAAMVVPMIEAILTETDIPAPAPVGHWIDAKERKGGSIRLHSLTWLRSVLLAELRTRKGRNPRAL